MSVPFAALVVLVMRVYMCVGGGGKGKRWRMSVNSVDKSSFVELLWYL